MHDRSARADRPLPGWVSAGLTLGAMLTLILLAGCGYERPQSTMTPGLDTGVTASSGGGMTNSVRPIGTPTRVP